MRASDLLIVGGALAIVIGVLIRFGLFGWFGNLPGDLRFESDRTSVFIPITSMLIVSVVLSVIANLLLRLFRN
jgi:hypothetical protein